MSDLPRFQQSVSMADHPVPRVGEQRSFTVDLGNEAVTSAFECIAIVHVTWTQLIVIWEYRP